MSARRSRGAAALLAALAALLAAASLGVFAPGAAATAAASHARRAPARRMQAYLLASAPDSLRDLRAHARSIGVVYPTYFECALASAAVTGADDAAVTTYARSQRIAVMPRFNCQDGATVHLILTEPQARAATLARLVAIARDPSYAGLNLDLENDAASDRQALTSFVGALAQRAACAAQEARGRRRRRDRRRRDAGRRAV